MPLARRPRRAGPVRAPVAFRRPPAGRIGFVACEAQRQQPARTVIGADARAGDACARGHATRRAPARAASNLRARGPPSEQLRRAGAGGTWLLPAGGTGRATPTPFVYQHRRKPQEPAAKVKARWRPSSPAVVPSCCWAVCQTEREQGDSRVPGRRRSGGTSAFLAPLNWAASNCFCARSWSHGGFAPRVRPEEAAQVVSGEAAQHRRLRGGWLHQALPGAVDQLR